MDHSDKVILPIIICINFCVMHRRGTPPPGLDPAGRCPANPENKFENGAKLLCLKGKGRTISLCLHQKCLNINSSGHKEPQNSDFSNHLMLIVMIVSLYPRCSNLVIYRLESECGTEKLFSRFRAPPYFKSWIHPCTPSVTAHAAGHIVPQLMYWSDQLPSAIQTRTCIGSFPLSFPPLFLSLSPTPMPSPQNA